MERPTPSDMLPKRDHERDLELDKKIEALRRKNEALMKRYKEVEEDKKRAEEDGMALQSRKGKADDLTITISKSTSDSRVVVTKPFSGGTPAVKGQPEAGPERGGDEGPPSGAGLGLKRQLMVTMAGKKGKRVVSERPEKRPSPADMKPPAEEGQARRAEAAGTGRGRPPSHTTKKETAAQDEVKQGQKHSEEHHRLSEELESLPAGTDLNIPTSKEEQEEYLRWKKERDQIDRERVARHKNAKGQWRRAWDLDKTDNMFTDKSLPDRDWATPSRGGRNARRGQHRQNADSRGHEKRGKDKGAKNVLVMGSKAKGKDRLTGRARRWQDNEEGDNPQTCDAALEDYLEELDGLTDAEAEDPRDPDPKAKSSPSPDSMNACEEVRDSEEAPAQGKADASPPRASEKKVRFSEELVQVAPPPPPPPPPPPSPSSSKTSSPKKNKREAPAVREDGDGDRDSGGPRDQGADPTQAECTTKDSPPPTAPSSPPAEKACEPPSPPPMELTKCGISNADELIDSGLSVLSLESGEAHPAHPTSSDKAREHGKIV